MSVLAKSKTAKAIQPVAAAAEPIADPQLAPSSAVDSLDRGTARPGKSGRSWWMALAVLAVVIAVWEAATRLLNISPRILPAPSVIATSGFDDAANLLEAARITAIEVGVGTVIAVALGIALAFALWWAKTAGQAAMPLLVISQTIPIVAIAPLLIIWFGFGITSKVLLVALFGLFPIVVSLSRGLESPTRDQIDVAHSLGASDWWILTKVRMPAAARQFMSGLRIAVTYGPATAATAEFVGARNGLGIYLLTAQSSFRTDLVFVGAAVLTVMTLLIYVIVAIIERLVVPWSRIGGQDQ